MNRHALYAFCLSLALTLGVTGEAVLFELDDVTGTM
jgi:hypothetical protein